MHDYPSPPDSNNDSLLAYPSPPDSNQDFMPFTRTSYCDHMNANDANNQFNIEQVINTFHGTTRPKHMITQVIKV